MGEGTAREEWEDAWGGAEGFVGSMGDGRSASVSAGGDGVAYCMSWSEELRALNPVLIEYALPCKCLSPARTGGRIRIKVLHLVSE